MKLVEVPLTVPWVAVSVVLWASKRVTEAVPTPFVKLTEAGYVGAVPLGELAGPLNPMACAPA